MPHAGNEQCGWEIWLGNWGEIGGKARRWPSQQRVKGAGITGQ